MIFFSYLIDFSHFRLIKKYPKVAEQVKNEGVDCFSYFSLICNYFIF